jgi:mRNA interferase MazF
MKRGEIWTVAGGGDFIHKPRPAVIVQEDQFDSIRSTTICPFTTNLTDAPLFRVAVVPSQGNGLRSECRLMADKVTTVSKRRLGSRVGRLGDEDMVRLNRALVTFLGLAGASSGD